MIQINGQLLADETAALNYFEYNVKKITDMFLGDSPEKEDCRQELRLKVWALFKDPNRTFNSAYVVRRLKWDTVNFINRDVGYNWWKFFSELPANEEECPALESTVETSLILQDLIVKARPQLTDKMYEALCVFLSGTTRNMACAFYGSKTKNLTSYYLALSDAMEVLRNVANRE